jgi:hypothetical protein
MGTPAGDRKLELELVLAAIGRATGNVSAAAKALGVTRQTLYTFIEENPVAVAALKEARETMLDEAESVLYRKALDGSTAELLFFLKTQGKGRGYVERSELTGADGGPVALKDVPDDELDRRLAQLEAEVRRAAGGEAPPPGAGEPP